MDGIPSNDNEQLYQELLAVAKTLIERYQWKLLASTEVAQRALRASGGNDQPKSELDRIKLHYSLALYQACYFGPLELRTIAYTDLHQYLYAIARSSRWADHAEDISNRAIVLVHEQINRCEKPNAFLMFAQLQLRRACTEHVRAIRRELPIGTVLEVVYDPDEDRASLLDREACLRMVLALIGALPAPQRQIILLKFLEALDDERISERLHLSISNVRVIRHRTLTQLRANQQLRQQCLHAELI
ncbi:MAG: sigma-70 family RNA polymerase sigma factor [Gammaproteobacteria bacterium]|nr:sigma-70 family RNA polymerase sigma factor [Gammaproteobacteria bacterium]